MNIPADLRFTKDHEWVRVEGNRAIVGITDFAQSELGDIVFIELPEVGKKLLAHNNLAVIESVKAVSDIFTPVAGTITTVNDALVDAPETINGDPYTAGWIAEIEMTDSAAVSDLLTAAQYQKLVEEAS
jgi:glycine cleavage system H protein